MYWIWNIGIIMFNMNEVCVWLERENNICSNVLGNVWYIGFCWEYILSIGF